MKEREDFKGKIQGNILKSIVKMIDGYYKLRGVSNMFFINVIKHITQSPSFLNLNEGKKTRNFIDFLHNSL